MTAKEIAKYIRGEGGEQLLLSTDPSRIEAALWEIALQLAIANEREAAANPSKSYPDNGTPTVYLRRPKRGGGRRPGMSEAEKQQVSARMKKFWATWREEHAVQR